MSNFLYQISEAEGQILLFIQNHLRFDFLTPFVVKLTHLGDAGIFWIILTVILLIIPKTRKVGVVSALALLTTFLINNMWLKPMIDRTRPYDMINGLICLVPPENDASFPSGHTAIAITCGVAIWKTSRKWWGWLCLVLAIAISLSRLYVGVHFPTDVIAAAVIGAAVAMFWYILIGKREFKKKKKKRRH